MQGALLQGLHRPKAADRSTGQATFAISVSFVFQSRKHKKHAAFGTYCMFSELLRSVQVGCFSSRISIRLHWQLHACTEHKPYIIQYNRLQGKGTCNSIDKLCPT